MVMEHGKTATKPNKKSKLKLESASVSEFVAEFKFLKFDSKVHSPARHDLKCWSNSFDTNAIKQCNNMIFKI